MKAIKSDSDSDSYEQKSSPGFSGKNRGVTPSVAAPGLTHPSDAIAVTLTFDASILSDYSRLTSDAMRRNTYTKLK